MKTGTQIGFNEQAHVLDATISSYCDIINQDGMLSRDFISALFEGYKRVEVAAKREQRKKMAPLRRVAEIVRETIGKGKMEYELPVKGIRIRP